MQSLSIFVLDKSTCQATVKRPGPCFDNTRLTLGSGMGMFSIYIIDIIA